VQNFGEVDAKVATSAIDDAVAGNPLLVFVGAVTNGEKVSFTAKAGAEAVKHGAHAGKLVGEIARIAGGGGGGRPDFATAGGKDITKIDEALAIAESVLQIQVG
jgi:alanyl-tRNA synthetase